MIRKSQKTDDFEQHINKYNVISLDITGFISAARQNGLSLREVPAMIKKAIRKDLVEEGFEPFENDSVSDFLIRCARNSRRFIFVIDYISKDYNGLTKTIAELIGGVDVKITTTGFANDLTSFKGKDDVLTLLVHLGYLAYDSESKTVRIPNEEIKLEFQRSIHEVKHESTLRRIEESEQLFADTISQNEQAVAAGIEKIHTEETVALHYNKEDSLRSVIKLAYYTYRDHYIQFEELPAGTGFADIVYIPLPDTDWPALVIELEWNKDAETAIDQIMKRQYPSCLKNLRCPILLVGITYYKNAEARERRHVCRITEYTL